MFKLFLLFTVVPAVELYLLVRIGEWMGAFETVWMVVTMGFVGAWLAKREGLGVLRQIQEDLGRGIPPADRIVEGLMVLVGSVLLITPGVLTDLVAIFLLVPPIRRALAPVVRRRIVGGVLGPGGFTFRSQTMSFRVGAPEPREGPVRAEREEKPAGGPRFDHPVA